MNKGRQWLAAGAIGNVLYALGGSGGAATAEYAKIAADGSLGSWTVGATLLEQRFHASGAAASGRLFAVGGYNGNPNGYLADSESARQTPAQ
jgi:hypothetical protein